MLRYVRDVSACAVLLLLGALSETVADIPAGAPNTGERILLIYNGLGAANYQFSEPAQKTFRAALSGNAAYAIRGAADAGMITAFTPLPDRVDILNITQTTGIYTALKAAYDAEIPDSLNGGRELSFWSQVYDLRFDNNQSGVEALSLDLASPSSDISLYKNFLQNGGGLFVQSEYSVFVARNQGVTSLINMLTNDLFNVSLFDQGVQRLQIKSFPATPENFATDFNDLNYMFFTAADYLTMIWAGSYPMAGIKAQSLMTNPNNGNSHLLFWNSQNLKTQNGRFIVSFDINCWSDISEGTVGRVAYALVQNIYDLFSGIQSYAIAKAFIPDHVDVNQAGTRFDITVTNSGKVALKNVPVVDTVASCLSVTSASLPWASNVGNVYSWTIPNIDPGASYIISVNYIATRLP